MLKVELGGKEAGRVLKLVDMLTSLFGSWISKLDAETTKIDLETENISEPSFKVLRKEVELLELKARQEVARTTIEKSKVERREVWKRAEGVRGENRIIRGSPDGMVKNELTQDTREVKHRFKNEALKNGLQKTL